jgi:hypothetical protein
MSDIQLTKTKIDASGRKIATLGQEYIRAKTEPDARKSLVKMMSELSIQTSLLAEQNAQLDRNLKGIK